jgi:Predicted nucleotide-binding protein containing TIR-like domain
MLTHGENKLTEVDPSIAHALAYIQSALDDLRAADYQGYEWRVKKLAQALHVRELDAITRKLTAGIDLDTWLETNNAAAGGMMGSAAISWPSDDERVLGIIALLLNRFAEKSGSALRFAMTFYHAGSRKPNDDLQKMTRQILVPFVRDYINYVQVQTAMSPSPIPIPSMSKDGNSPNKKVFVVHGRDDAAKHEVALFLSTLSLEPIILHLRPNGGRHLLMKFRDESEGAGFAVVLMTPDDEGDIVGTGEPHQSRREAGAAPRTSSCTGPPSVVLRPVRARSA